MADLSTNGELSCKELVELVTDYLEGKLPASERERFDRHLSYCTPCANYLHQMQLTIKTLGELTETSIEPQARDELLRIFRNWKADSE